jgi:hypothetical protein
LPNVGAFYILRLTVLQPIRARLGLPQALVCAPVALVLHGVAPFRDVADSRANDQKRTEAAMNEMYRLNELREHGRMRWQGEEHGWIAHPDDVVAALAQDGFQEYKRELATSRRHWGATGGVWQGLNTRTGAVASAIWVARPGPQEALVFIDIDGRPLEGSERSGSNARFVEFDDENTH